MTHYDVFNGDADGICALHQLRLAAPIDSVLVTGTKRDIALLQRIPAQAGDTVTALDISAATNHDALVGLLDRGVHVDYYDHHHAGELPEHSGLSARIDTSALVCTGVLVDRRLHGRYRRWAIVAAYGDNLRSTAAALGRTLGLDDDALEPLRLLGEALNYNAYGETEADLLVHPVALYRALRPHVDPEAFLGDPLFAQLDTARGEDLARARRVGPAFTTSHAAAFVLPNAAWSRRVRGIIGNELANDQPGRAHAVLTPDATAGYTVSVRAPLRRRHGADALCRRFGGNGRPAAAGINGLPRERLDEFLRAFADAYGTGDVANPVRDPPAAAEPP